MNNYLLTLNEDKTRLLLEALTMAASALPKGNPVRREFELLRSDVNSAPEASMVLAPITAVLEQATEAYPHFESERGQMNLAGAVLAYGTLAPDHPLPLVHVPDAGWRSRETAESVLAARKELAARQRKQTVR